MPWTPDEALEILARARELLRALDPPAEYLTVEEAATIIKRNHKEVYALVASGEIPAYRAGERSIRIVRADLDAWVKSRPYLPGA